MIAVGSSGTRGDIFRLLAVLVVVIISGHSCAFRGAVIENTRCAVIARWTFLTRGLSYIKVVSFIGTGSL